MKLKRIRDLREDNDLTQDEIAKYLNVTQRTYSRYENDDRAIPLEQLVKLADYYNTSVDYLLNRTDKKSHIKKVQVFACTFWLYTFSNHPCFKQIL